MGRRKKTRTHIAVTEETGPKSFVVKSGDIGHASTQLVQDFRKTMLPCTAANLKERKTNKVRDFVHVAGQLGVTHLICFTPSGTGGVNLRMGRIPRGPTLYFHVEDYVLAKDIMKSQQRPLSRPMDFATSPLVVLNNFGDNEKHIKIITTMIQNMYPTIKVTKMRLAEARRVILYNWNKETGLIEFRHYCITVKSVGLSKSVKSIIHSNVPDLTNYQDISDFVMKGSFASESDVEDMDSKVNIPSKGKSESNVQQRAIKLVEIGPRLSLRLAKIQDGLCQGEIVHHEFVVKSSSEIVALKEKKKAVEDERARRRAEQERNVKAKELANSKSKPDEADGEVSDAGSDGDSNEGDDAMSQDEGIANEEMSELEEDMPSDVGDMDELDEDQ